MKNNITIGVFATSEPLVKQKREKDYAYLKSKGFVIKEAEQVRNRIGHTAGSIEDRINSIHAFIKDEEVDILMSYWGGANTNQILPYIDYELIKSSPKPIIGFSDTSALLLAINKKSGIKTYMGPAGITFDKPDPFDYTFDYFSRTVTNKNSEVIVKDSEKYADDLYFLREDSDHRILKENHGRKVYNHGKAEGKIIASNLQTLLVLMGTDYFPNLENTVLFLEEAEDLSPSMYHRFLTHLSQAVNLNALSAICIGRLSEANGFRENDSEEMIYDDIFSVLDIPIIYNLDFGHTDPMFTIPIGGTAYIDTQNHLLSFKI
jgi:muramoyltetrapeptide carboxypeptidase